MVHYPVHTTAPRGPDQPPPPLPSSCSDGSKHRQLACARSIERSWFGFKLYSVLLEAPYPSSRAWWESGFVLTLMTLESTLGAVAEQSFLWCFICSSVRPNMFLPPITRDADLHSQTSLIFFHPDVNIIDSVRLRRNNDRLGGSKE